MGLWDMFAKKQQAAPPVEGSGFEEDGSRPTEVQTPSFMNNLSYGLKGGTEGKSPLQAGSFGEGFGKFLNNVRMNQGQQAGVSPTSPQAPPMQKKKGFGGILSMLGY